MNDLTNGQFMGGWLYSLRAIIDSFNTEFTGNQINPLSNGVIMSGVFSAIFETITAINSALVDADYQPITPFLNPEIISGWRYMLPELIKRVNESLDNPPIPDFPNITVFTIDSPAGTATTNGGVATNSNLSFYVELDGSLAENAQVVITNSSGTIAYVTLNANNSGRTAFQVNHIVSDGSYGFVAVIKDSVGDSHNPSAQYDLTVSTVVAVPPTANDFTITSDGTEQIVDVLAHLVAGDNAIDPTSLRFPTDQTTSTGSHNFHMNELWGDLSVAKQDSFTVTGGVLGVYIIFNDDGTVIFTPDNATIALTDSLFKYVVKDVNGIVSNEGTITYSIVPV